MKILNVISSTRRAASNSTQLANAIIKRLTEQDIRSTVKLRDLVERHYPHLEESHLNAFFAPHESAAPEYMQATQHSDEAIKEVLELI